VTDPTAPSPRVSVVIPAYNEGGNILPVLDRLLEAVKMPCEVLIVVDFPDDSTISAVEAYSRRQPAVRTVVNDLGRGPAFAIRYGIQVANASVVVVTMADGCDDPRQVEELTRLVERGVVVAAASRYMPGGQQVGGPIIKRLMSRGAGRSLYVFARIGTRDATNSFKAYSRDFVNSVGIESQDGFEIGLELTAKARRLRLPVAEIPTIWLDRPAGVSNFKVTKWLPKYLRWYRFAFGPRLELEDIKQDPSRSPNNAPPRLERTKQ
jgi:dolichol-phosphate mannosyltransferase